MSDDKLLAEYDEFRKHYIGADVMPMEWCERARDRIAALEAELAEAKRVADAGPELVAALREVMAEQWGEPE